MYNYMYNYIYIIHIYIHIISIYIYSYWHYIHQVSYRKRRPHIIPLLILFPHKASKEFAKWTQPVILPYLGSSCIWVENGWNYQRPAPKRNPLELGRRQRWKSKKNLAFGERIPPLVPIFHVIPDGISYRRCALREVTSQLSGHTQRFLRLNLVLARNHRLQHICHSQSSIPLFCRPLAGINIIQLGSTRFVDYFFAFSKS